MSLYFKLFGGEALFEQPDGGHPVQQNGAGTGRRNGNSGNGNGGDQQRNRGGNPKQNLLLYAGLVWMMGVSSGVMFTLNHPMLTRPHSIDLAKGLVIVTLVALPVGFLLSKMTTGFRVLCLIALVLLLFLWSGGIP